MTTSASKRVLVTGARGQLAGAVIEAYRRSAEVFAYSREQLDITDANAVSTRVGADRPDVIVNCAAFNHVDQAEDEPEKALTINAFAVRVLARVAKEFRATFVHYSSDFVFDGLTSRPYTEEDHPNPLGAYAASKLLSEWFAGDASPVFILRVESLFGGRDGGSSLDRIIRTIAEGGEARVFVDRTVSPSYIVDVAEATRALVERGEPGLYHCVGTGYATWYEVAKEIARLVGKEREAKLRPVCVADVPLRASRPKFAALSNDKLRRIFPMPTWQDALRRYLT